MRYPIASQHCQDLTKDAFHSYGFETYYDPVITVSGGKAVVKALIETGSYLGDYTFKLVRKDKAWLVSDASYVNIHYKGD
jgi:hypothetical protein